MSSQLPAPMHSDAHVGHDATANRAKGLPVGDACTAAAATKPLAARMNLMTVPDSVIAVVVKEHEAIKTLSTQYRQHALTDLVERENLAAAIIKNLSMHIFLEENVLYPYYASILAESGKIAEKRSLDEHRKLKEYLHEADQIFNVRDPTFNTRLEEALSEFQLHAVEEESALLLDLQERIPLEKLKELAKEYDTKRHIAPTRPHPKIGGGNAGDSAHQAGASTLAGMAAKAGDALRDAASGRAAMAQRGAKQE